MIRPIRIEWRSGTLGQKIDECGVCGQVGRHRLERQVRWLLIGPIPAIPLGLRHGLECSVCRAWQPLPWRTVRRGLRSGSLALPGRPRPVIAALVGAGRPSPDLDAVSRSRSVDGATAYFGVWVLVILILAGLWAQPVGREDANQNVPMCLAIVGAAPGSPLPTPPFRVQPKLCIFPHNFEPLASPSAPFDASATLPPDGAFGSGVQATCDQAFRAQFGGPGADGPQLVIIGPDPSAWAAGDRQVWCAAADPANPWRDSVLPK
jgi:hypothetical protein